MKTYLLLMTLWLPIFAVSQNTGDTIVVPTINYSQTYSPNGRDTMVHFPDTPGQTYEKIIMAYNMRCKDGNISVPGNTNIGCGEWDYKCNTFITDSSRVDSILNFQASHAITHFSGDTFYFTENPMADHYQYRQWSVQLNNIISENPSTVGAGNLTLDHVVNTAEHSGKSQYLYTAQELTAAGVTTGNIDGISLEALSAGEAAYFRVKMKNTQVVTLDPTAPDTSGFSDVYFHDYNFQAGINRIQFFTPFEWDGASNILIEFSFTNADPAAPLTIKGESTSGVSGMFSNNLTHIYNDAGYLEVPAGPLSSVNEEITVSFWTWGSEAFMPAPTSIISGVDDNNNRQLNVHLPWSNSSIYFDCGYDGGYDRINKEATPSEFKGRWNHWAFTKNAATGDMKIYLNGELWHSGTGKTNPINITNLKIGDIHGGNRFYYGKIDECRIWNKALDQQTIQDWMNVTLNESHPDYSNLVAYYRFDEGSGTATSDDSPNGETAQMNGYEMWQFDRGNTMSRGFEAVMQRPNVTFLQGEYDLTVNEENVTENVERIANVVTEYEIIPRYGTMLDDSIAEVSSDQMWQAGYEYTYDPDGEVVDSVEIAAAGYIPVGELTYYKRYPSKYEIMSFVTPYGIYLDLGLDGKTWLFDVTDYAPILKGWKRLSVELGGQRQEDMDIKFWYILGTPPRDVIDINQLWRASSNNYTALMNDRAFEPREFTMNPEGVYFKVRSVITGHGQQGEFTQRWHSLNIDGDVPEFEWKVWKECSTVPIYPQGGTWIFDRAGWCPGDPSDLYEYDITPYVGPGETHTIDYNLTYASGESNYQVNNQLVTYGPANFENDAAVVAINNPNAEVAAYERFNPACSYPVVVIKNTGSNTLTSVDISYFANDNEPLNYTWTGSLAFLETAEVELPITDYSFWSGNDNIFTVAVSNPNNQEDEYSYNNSYDMHFETVDLYDISETLTIECKTNNQGYQTSYQLTDMEGNVIFEHSDLENTTIYTDEVTLEPGCYQLRIDDSGDNGLYFWYYPNYGTGYLRVKDSDGNILYDFEPEFGRFAIYEFGMVDFTGTYEYPGQSGVVSVYPNPADDRVHISIAGMENNIVDARLYSAGMELLYENQFCVEGRDFTEDIPVDRFPTGIYLLELEYDGRTITRKIVVK